MPRVVALSGGVGGAKLVSGLADLLPPEDLAVIVNTGDDFVHWGLHIAPDLDTVMYTLAGLAHPVQGWGIAGDTFTAADAVVICPSNPYVSVDPIVTLPGMREALRTRPVIAVSPIVGGKAIK